MGRGLNPFWIIVPGLLFITFSDCFIDTCSDKLWSVWSFPEYLKSTLNIELSNQGALSKIKISISISVEGLIHSSCVIVEIVFRRSGRRSRWLCQRRMRSEVLVHCGTEGHRSARVRGPPVLHHTRRGGNLCWIQSFRHRTDSLWTFITLFIKMVSIHIQSSLLCTLHLMMLEQFTELLQNIQK